MKAMLMLVILTILAISSAACTNTVRGFGQDVGSQDIQNYNNRSAIDY